MTKSLTAVCMLTALCAFGQQPKQNPYTPVAPMPVGDILLTLPSSHIPDAGTWEVRFSHRFNQSLDQGEAFRSLLGLDAGANVALGLSYVPFRDFEISLLRSNVLDTYDLAAKYVLTQQARRLANRTMFLWNGEVIELDHNEVIFSDRPGNRKTYEYVNGIFG